MGESLVVETTWSTDAPSKTADSVDVVLGGDYTSSAPEYTAAPTTGSIELTESVTPIDTDLPDGEADVTTTSTKPDIKKPPTQKPGAQVADTGAQAVAFGGVAMICATLLF